MSIREHDDLDELIAEYEAQSPGFTERVEAVYQERVAAREHAQREGVQADAGSKAKREAS